MTDDGRSENVQVVVRVRQLNASERSSGHKNVVRVDAVNNSVSICNSMEKSASASTNSFNESEREFTFDSVFGSDSSQVLYQSSYVTQFDSVLKYYDF